MRIFLVAGLLLAATPLQAANWLQIGTGDNGSRVLIDLDSIETEGDYTSAWVQNFYPMTKNASRSIKDRTRSTKEIWKFNCKSRSMAVIYYVAYDNQGSSIYTDKSGYAYPSYGPVIPDSLGESVMNFSCRRNIGQDQ